MEIKVYREHIKHLAARRDGEAVFNGSADHAAVIVENLLASAQNSARLLTGDLNAKVYGSPAVVERAKQFLGHSDHRLEIVVENVTFSPSHPLVQAIGGEENVSFYHVPEQISHTLPYHFMTADHDCFRFEREKNSHVAVAAFGDVDTTTHLNTIFDTIRASCQKLDMAEIVG